MTQMWVTHPTLSANAWPAKCTVSFASSVVGHRIAGSAETHSYMKPSFTLHSPETGTDYLIYIQVPTETPVGQPWSTMLFMDGDDQFTTAVKAYDKLAKDHRPQPDVLLVGVGYGASYAKPQNKRFRDYTPTVMPGEPGTGGAGNFLKFLSNTLWPELSGRFSLSPTERGIGGHSLGSLLALYALFQPKPFFNRFLISSPSVWYDDRSIVRIAGELRDRQTRLPARAFLSVGEEDSPSMTGDLTILEEKLAARPFDDLDLIHKRYAKHDHYTAILPAFEDGLAILFSKETGH